MILNVVLIALVILLAAFILMSRRKTSFRTESIIHKVERISELSTARMTTLLIFEPERESLVPGTFQRFIFIVPFQVRGYVDLKKLKEDSIEIHEGEARRIKLILPSPRLEVTIPQSKIPDIRVINQSGVLTRIFGNRDMLKTFQSYSDEIEKQALQNASEMGVEETSRESARNFFHGLFLGMGFDEVVVLFEQDNSLETNVEIEKAGNQRKEIN
ncbi:DUF4230 domain-containing protein [Mesotoga prima]|uniref:DUF4230 domain-containing protein n=1 Tax=Mesotoga prima TaxID=1184387 RepID=UPI002FDACDDF